MYVNLSVQSVYEKFWFFHQSIVSIGLILEKVSYRFVRIEEHFEKNLDKFDVLL